jgi:hypothetical protein
VARVVAQRFLQRRAGRRHQRHRAFERARSVQASSARSRASGEASSASSASIRSRVRAAQRRITAAASCSLDGKCRYRLPWRCRPRRDLVHRHRVVADAREQPPAASRTAASRSSYWVAGRTCAERRAWGCGVEHGDRQGGGGGRSDRPRVEGAAVGGAAILCARRAGSDSFRCADRRWRPLSRRGRAGRADGSLPPGTGPGTRTPSGATAPARR